MSGIYTSGVNALDALARGRKSSTTKGFLRVGSFLDEHTVAELQELLTAKDYEQKQIEAAFVALDKSKVKTDVVSDWSKDWTALKARYQKARIIAQAKIEETKKNLVLDAAHSGAEDEWQLVLHSLTRETGKVQKGDVQDVYNRVVAMGAHVDESNVPQPTASSDPALRAFKGLDANLPKTPDIHFPDVNINPSLNPQFTLNFPLTTIALVGGGLVAFGMGLWAVVRLSSGK